MSEYDIKAVQLGVRSSNPALPRQWTNMLVSLTANGIQYSPAANPEKVSLLIDLAGIDSIGNYDSGKSEPAFQVKWKGSTTLHKCADAATVDTWVYKVMAAKMGPSKTSDTESSDEEEEENSSEEEEVQEVPAKKLTKSEDRSKKSKSTKDKKDKVKSKTTEVASSSSGSKKKSSTSSSSSSSSKKDKEKEKEKKSKGASSKENGKEKKADSPSVSKRSKSESGTDSYVPQFMAHYNGLKLQERQKYFEGLSTQDLVKLVSGGLEAEVKENREQILREWAATKKAKLLELHELELAELQKKHQRELDDLPKRTKEFMEQSI